MLNLNLFAITGIVKSKPVKYQTKNGKFYTTLEVMSDRQYADMYGNKLQDVYTFKFWGDFADNIMSLNVGDLVGVKGRLQTDSYTDKNNTTRYSIVLIPESITMNK